MSLQLITPATSLPISLAEAKAHARLDGLDEDDALLAGYISSATASVEQYLGVALITSTWRFHRDMFPCWWWAQPIRIPLSPVQAVTSITYLDVVGVEQVLDPSVYVVSGIGDVGWINLAPGQSWPATRWRPEAVTIDFVAGFGDSWNSIPEPIRTAIAELARGYYDGCHADVDGLLAPYRVVPI